MELKKLAPKDRANCSGIPPNAGLALTGVPAYAVLAHFERFAGRGLHLGGIAPASAS